VGQALKKGNGGFSVSKHTPWLIDECSSFQWDIVYGDASGDIVCILDSKYAEFRDDWKENARLIAAAPDLLKALEQIAMNGSISQIICKADRNFMDAAIAKAKGETE